jgi:hypothetical protein
MGKQEGIDLLLQASAHVHHLKRTDIQFGLVSGGQGFRHARLASS